MEKRIETILTGITIDDTKSLDLDDGFWIEETPENYILRVFIANVASKVDPRLERRKLYEMAYSRVETQYFYNSHDPMIPFSMSENWLSLLPGRVRNALCFEFKIDKQTFGIKNFKFYECRFRSIRKMAYSEVHSFLIKQELIFPIHEDIKKVLSLGSLMAMHLLEQRQNQGALIVYDAFNTFTMSEEGRLVAIGKEKHSGYILIQELMILVNSTVAEFAVKKGIPIVFRTHRVKDSHTTKNDLLREFRLVQINPDPSMLIMVQKRLQYMLENAAYSAKHGEHWALSLPWYAHVTSPIRRLADLINQLNLVAYLRKETWVYEYDQIDRIASHINETINRHEKERDLLSKEKDLKKLSMNSTVEWLSNLNSKNFSKYLKLAFGEQGSPSDIFLEEIRKRIREERIENRDFVFIIFNKKFAEQKVIKTEALHLLLENKGRIKSVLSEACQGNEGNSIEITFNKKDDTFEAFAIFVFGESTFISDIGFGRSKQQASDEACRLLFQKMFKIEAKKPQKHSLEKLKTTKDSQPFSLVKVLEENYASALIEMAQKAKIGDPAYVFKELGTQQKGLLFLCSVEFVVNGAMISMQAKAPSKKIAKSLAAKSMYEKLQSENF